MAKMEKNKYVSRRIQWNNRFKIIVCNFKTQDKNVLLAVVHNLIETLFYST